MQIQTNSLLSQIQVWGQEKNTGKRQTVSDLLAETNLSSGKADPAVKVSISREGMEAYRAMVAEKGPSSGPPDMEEIGNSTILLEQLYGSISTGTVYFATEEEVREGKDMSHNIVSLWFSDEVSSLRETDGGNSWRDKASSLAQAYTNLYSEIVQGYQDGTRQVRVIEEGATVSDLAQGRGYRVLTMEEELAELDRVYENSVRNLEKQAESWPEQLEIFVRMDRSISGATGREPYYTEEHVRTLEEDYKTVPDNLAQRLLSVRDYWKLNQLNLSKDKAWESVVDMINTMFQKRE